MVLKDMFLYVIRTCISVEVVELICKEFSDWLTLNGLFVVTCTVYDIGMRFPFSNSTGMSPVILDVIKYCDCPRWYEKIPSGGGTSVWRWDLHLEVRPPFGLGLLLKGETSDWRWDLCLEVTPPFRGEISYQRWDLCSEVTSTFRGEAILEVRPPFGGGTSVQMWHLHSEVKPLIGSGTTRGDTLRWDLFGDMRWHLHLQVRPLSWDETFKWRSQLQLAVISLLACRGVGCIFICSDI